MTEAPRHHRRWLGRSLSLIGCILLCQAVGGIGTLAMRDPATWRWFNQLAKPPIQPPDWLFGPVWAVLYTLMGIALWQVIGSPTDTIGKPRAIRLFICQLALNMVWTPLFFGSRAIGMALVDIIGLWLILGLTIVAFQRVHRTAAALLLPYWLWVSFAALLNAWLWWLNG